MEAQLEGVVFLDQRVQRHTLGCITAVILGRFSRKAFEILPARVVDVDLHFAGLRRCKKVTLIEGQGQIVKIGGLWLAIQRGCAKTEEAGEPIVAPAIAAIGVELPAACCARGGCPVRSPVFMVVHQDGIADIHTGIG